ncbi:MAG TPA: glycosyltransferase, partial [Flavobacterium sp.]|nr:glycosyltransferase [Flavobacterium sp.]
NFVPWEVIIVDNNSKDNTSQVAIIELSKYNSTRKRYKIVHEQNPGLNKARSKGILSSKFEYIVFVDDDNWLSKTYIETIYQLFNKHHKLGIIGAGHAYGEYEIDPPNWFLQYKHFCAIFENRITDEIGYTIDKNVIACGAGMGIRKQLAIDYFNDDKSIKISDRTENLLLSGGDSDMNYFVLKRGYGVGKFISLSFKHFMPKERISKQYLKKLAHGLSYSSALLAHKNGLPANQWTVRGYFFAFVKTLIFKGIFHLQILKNQYQGQKDAHINL